MRVFSPVNKNTAICIFYNYWEGAIFFVLTRGHAYGNPEAQEGSLKLKVIAQSR